MNNRKTLLLLLGALLVALRTWRRRGSWWKAILFIMLRMIGSQIWSWWSLKKEKIEKEKTLWQLIQEKKNKNWRCEGVVVLCFMEWRTCTRRGRRLDIFVINLRETAPNQTESLIFFDFDFIWGWNRIVPTLKFISWIFMIYFCEGHAHEDDILRVITCDSWLFKANLDQNQDSSSSMLCLVHIPFCNLKTITSKFSTSHSNSRFTLRLTALKMQLGAVKFIGQWLLITWSVYICNCKIKVSIELTTYPHLAKKMSDRQQKPVLLNIDRHKKCLIPDSQANCLQFKVFPLLIFLQIGSLQSMAPPAAIGWSTP